MERCRQMLGGINFIPQAASALPDVQRAAEEG